MLSRARRAVHLPYVAALAAGVLTLGGLQALAVDRADATPPATCTPTSNPLGAATGWTEFVEGNGTRGAESEGSIAYGGDFNGSGFTVGSHLPVTTPPSTPTLVVAGSHGTFNLQRGSAYLTPQTGVNFNGGAGTGYLSANPVDFAAAFTSLRATSSTWATFAPNGTATTVTANPLPGGQVTLVLTGTDPNLNVFQIGAADLGTKQVGIDAPQGSTVLINVTGSAPAFNNNMLIKQGSSWDQASDGVVKPGQQTAQGWPGIIWNFPSATSVQINSGSAFAGTVLAPNAAVSVGNAGHTIGQMIAKSFSSTKETHFNLLPSTVCLPGPAGDSDVTITKTASVASPHGGDSVTYSLLVQNLGDSPATGVTVTDTLPAGVTFVSATSPCTFASGTVTCAVGTLAAHASTTLTITVVANPVAGAGPSSHPQAHHWLTPYHSEVQVDLEPGEQKSVTLSCSPGDILADGQFRIDHVDQDTGTIAGSVKVLSSQYTGLGVGSWKGVIRNDATGRAQAKAFIVCLPAYTDAATRQTGYDDNHKHPLSVDPTAVTSTATYPAGRSTATLTCPVGTIPVAPGFDAPAGGVVLAGSEYDQAGHPRDWTFTLDAAAPTTVTLSARCLRTTVGPVYGHTHDLLFTHLVQTVTVSGHTAKEGDEFQVICPDDAKGIVSTWNLPPGVRHFGNDPRLKTRAFRLFNDSGTTKQATVDLLCMRDRTSIEGMGTTDPVVVTNTASVTSVSADANEYNNSSSATITVQPGSSTTSLAGKLLVSGAASLRVVSSMPGRAALSVRSKGALLARGTVGLRPGGAVTAELKLTRAGKRQLSRLDRVTVSVDPTRGRTVRQSVAVQR
jgi:choice-of-anchor A domain-containing protein/uncharacterized repeat protein (TIGR01451 family)